MPSVKNTQKYLKCSIFVDEMIDNGIFNKLGDEKVIEWEDKDKKLFWRIVNLTQNGDPFIEYGVSCRNKPVCKTKKEYSKSMIRKRCWIYREPFETDDKYKFIHGEYCVTGIETK